jgi:glyoxylase-like metal-dependent hydrolase (beta-lactamase superfamily II)
MIEVHRLHLTDVTPAPHLPWARPTYPVFAYPVLHPAGPDPDRQRCRRREPLHRRAVLSPVHHDLDEALGVHGIRVDDIETVITPHLHFDHCGQNYRFPHAPLEAGLCQRMSGALRISTVIAHPLPRFPGRDPRTPSGADQQG